MIRGGPFTRYFPEEGIVEQLLVLPENAWARLREASNRVLSTFPIVHQ